MSGLDCLVNIVNLNLSDNMIERISCLGTLEKLSTLQLKRNQIGADGIPDLIGLLECQSISALDLSDNKIETEDIIPEVLQKMCNLSVVYLQNNGFNKKISHYRKTLITKIPTLKYIDDKPIFEDEKRYADAWARGGLEEEKK